MLKRLRRSDVAKNVLTLSTGNFLGQVINIGSIPILSRLYEPEAFGFLAVYVSVSTLLTVIGTGRYEFAILLPDSRHEAIAVKQLARRLLWTVSFVILLIFALFLDEIASLLGTVEFKHWMLTVPINIVLLGEISILNYWHTREKNFRKQSRNRILLNAVTVSLQLTLGTWIFADVRGLILGVLMAQISAWIFLTRQQGINPVERHSVSVHDLASLMSRYRKMPLLNAPTALLDSTRTNGVNFIIGNQSVSALGQYSMAWRSGQVPLGLIGSALSQVFFQKMSHESRGSLTQIIFKSMLGMLGTTFPILALFFFFAPYLIPFALGPEWEEAGKYAQALTPWLYLNLATSPIATVFIVTETQGRQAIFGIVYTVSALIALFLFRDNLLTAVWAMSTVMFVCLLAFTALAFATAKNYDRTRRLTTASDDSEGS